MEQVVNLTVTDNSIAVVEMNDKEHKNTFTPALIQGLTDAFEKINHSETIKCVIIQGDDHFFCCGGTKNELQKLAQGKMTFDELAFYRLLLDCKVPVISAMHGHSLGGGLVFGFYADVIIMAEERFYSANFMKYGFTPGMGATFILPYKLGPILSREMMFSADTFQGRDLRERGITAHIVPRTEVIEQAMQLAKKFSETDREAAILLKRHLNQKIHEGLPGYIEKEVEMHKITMQRPEVLDRVDKLFGN